MVCIAQGCAQRGEAFYCFTHGSVPPDLDCECLYRATDLAMRHVVHIQSLSSNLCTAYKH
jgi:hypothetical protein